MEYNSEVDSFSQNDSISSTTSSVRYREDIISSEEQSLLQLLQRGILETKEENIAYGKEILSLLNELHLEPQSLPSDIKEGLQKVASILTCEKLSEIDDIALSLMMERKKIEEKKRQYEEKQLALSYDYLFKKYTTYSKKLSYLQKAVDSLENNIDNARKEQGDIRCDLISLSTKLREYQQAVETLETDLTNMQIEHLYPKKILNKYHRYLEALGELADVNQYLSQYSDLPPNLLLAKAVVDVKQKEYETLEKAFFEKTNYYPKQ